MEGSDGFNCSDGQIASVLEHSIALRVYPKPSDEDAISDTGLVSCSLSLSDCKLCLQYTSSYCGVAGGDGELGCLCGKAGTSHLCDGSAHSSGCVVNGSNAMAAV